MDLSSASDQLSGVRRRLSSRKAAQLRSLCSCTPTAGLETESDDAVLLHRKISRSEGRIAAVHPPAPRRERKKSVIIIPLPAACIVSSSIIFLLLFPLFLASASFKPSLASIHLLPLKNNGDRIVYAGGNWSFRMTFGIYREPYNPDLQMNKVSLSRIPFSGYGSDFSWDSYEQKFMFLAGINRNDLDKLLKYAAQKVRESPDNLIHLDLEVEQQVKSPIFSIPEEIRKHIRVVSAISPSKQEDLGDEDVGTAILIRFKVPNRLQFNPHHIGVVFVAGRPQNWNILDKAKRQKAVKLSARSALSLILDYNKKVQTEKKKGQRINIYATNPIFEMALETMEGYNEAVNQYGKAFAPIIDFLDVSQRFQWALKESNITLTPVALQDDRTRLLVKIKRKEFKSRISKRN